MTLFQNRHEWLAASTILAVKPATAAQPYPSLVLHRPAGSPAIPFDSGGDRPWPVVAAIETHFLAPREPAVRCGADARPVLHHKRQG